MWGIEFKCANVAPKRFRIKHSRKWRKRKTVDFRAMIEIVEFVVASTYTVAILNIEFSSRVYELLDVWSE